MVGQHGLVRCFNVMGWFLNLLRGGWHSTSGSPLGLGGSHTNHGCGENPSSVMLLVLPRSQEEDAVPQKEQHGCQSSLTGRPHQNLDAESDQGSGACV